MNFSQFLLFNYWFNLRVGVLSGETKMWLVVVFGACLVLAVFFFFLNKKHQPPLNNLWRKCFIFFVTNAAFILIWGFFRQEAVPALGARFWFLILAVVDLIWLFYIIKYAVKKMPQEKKERAEKKQFSKYLPR